MDRLDVRPLVVGLIRHDISCLAVGLAEHVLRLDGLDVALVAWDMCLWLRLLDLLVFLQNMARDMPTVPRDDIREVVSV